MKKKKDELEENKSCGCASNCNCGNDCNCNEDNRCSEECTCGDNECCCSDDECCCGDEKDKLIEELQNKLMYKEAEFINFRRRKEEETSNMIKYASKELILDILKSIDNFERALKLSETDENRALLTGIRMIYNEEVETLKKYGVTEIDCSDSMFDHNLHDAVMVDENKDYEDGKILEVLQKGYKYHDKVIRTAMVKVNKLS